jgi:hypothetical protein
VARLCFQRGRQPLSDSRDGSAELGPARDMEPDRDRRQPLPGVHRRIAGGADQDASLRVAGALETAHRRPDIPGDLIIGSIEHDLGLELPTDPQVLLQQVHVVQVAGRTELLAACGDRLDPVDAVSADRTGAMRVAQQIPAAMPHHDSPRVNVLLPPPARLAAVPDGDPALGRDGGNECARGLGCWACGPAVGRGQGMPPDVSGRSADILRQRPDDLAEGGTDRIVGVGGCVAAVEHGHDQAKRLGGAEHQRRQPEATADSVAAVGPPGRLHGDIGLAQDRDVAARGAFSHAELCRKLGGGHARLGLQQLEGPECPRGGAEAGFHETRLIRNPIVRNRIYRRGQGRPPLVRRRRPRRSKEN